MPVQPLTSQEIAGEVDVHDNRLRLFERRELRRDADGEWEMGQWLLTELIQRLRAADEAKHRVTIRRLRLLRAIGAGRIFLAIAAKVSGITLADGNWADFLKRIVEWFMSEEGQAFIKMVIDLTMLLIGLISGL